MSAADREVLRRPTIIDRIAGKDEGLASVLAVAYFLQAQQLGEQKLPGELAPGDCYEKFLGRHPDLLNKVTLIEGAEVPILAAIRAAVLTANFRPTEGVKYEDLPRVEICGSAPEET